MYCISIIVGMIGFMLQDYYKKVILKYWKKMNLVKKDEFDVLKKMVQKLMIENEKLKQRSSRSIKPKKKTLKKKKTIKKKSKR